jgi:hypothetical protein
MGGLLGVIRAGLTHCQPLPVYPDQQTSADRPGMSQTCHEETRAAQQSSGGAEEIVKDGHVHKFLSN